MKSTNGTIHLSATDLANHLACRHLTGLNRKVASGLLKRPVWNDPVLAVLRQCGQEHEEAYIEFLRASGKEIANLDGKPPEATLESMRTGVDIIVQATVGDERWRGRIDILRKVATPSELGQWSYEVEDTKLAQETRTSTILQLCLYTHFVDALQGRMPCEMHVVKPGDGFPKESFRTADFQAFFRFARHRLDQTIAAPPDESTYPDPVSHCDVCNWWSVCDDKRHDDDHLSLIAGIRSLHIAELQRQGIATLAQFAEQHEPLKQKPERGTKEAFAKAHAQARIQLKGRKKGKLLHELLPAEPGRGLARLPLPSDGDIYFDIEKDAFFGEGGIEYLLGYALKDKKGKLKYQCHWGFNRAEEKAAFEAFMDFVMARWKKHPGMHIYHYSPYEPSAIKRLAGRHGTREIELDTLLRAERFVDLYAVVREGLIASVERYSLKDLERFTPFVRAVELPDAGAARRRLDSALELGLAVPDEDKATVEGYNRDDCVATEALHQWLEARRAELESTGAALERPLDKTGEASENVEERQRETQKVFDELVSGLPEDRTAWTEEEHARWLLAHMLDYYWREDKAAWWEFFRLHELDFEDLLDERKAIAGLSFMKEAGSTAKSIIIRYRYPPQEVGIDKGDELHEVQGGRVGTVEAIDHIHRTIDIKQPRSSLHHPVLVHQNERITPEPLASSLLHYARSVCEGTNRFRSATDLLKKNPPRLRAGNDVMLKGGEEDIQQAAIRTAEALDESCLAIQGPPGTGKTYTGGHMIAHLAAKGKRIGVTAVSHKVIRNLLESVLKAAKANGRPVSIVHKSKEKSNELPEGLEEVFDNADALSALGDGKVVGGTAWLWAREDAVETLDYLFVDEAGQMSLAQVLAAARSAKNIILLGDPQQLEQPQKGAHPEGADVAALTHLLDGHKTIPTGKGLFLGTTWRLHPDICAFTSELYYEDRLHSLEGLNKQTIGGKHPFAGSGLFYVPVEHRGNQIKSMEEVDTIAGIVSQLLQTGSSWTDRKGKKNKMAADDILIVAPYNGQVAALQERLPGMRIGTVDKFQGQEAPVVIYSMTSSTPEDAPRGMGFLYSPNRFNVATSRARCVVILVGSPNLFEPECKTVDHMRWTNALCRLRERAKLV